MGDIDTGGVVAVEVTEDEPAAVQENEEGPAISVLPRIVKARLDRLTRRGRDLEVVARRDGAADDVADLAHFRGHPTPFDSIDLVDLAAAAAGDVVEKGADVGPDEIGAKSF